MKKIALALSVVLLLGLSVGVMTACNKANTEYKVTIEGAANGKIAVSKGAEQVYNGNMATKGTELTVKADAFDNYMLDTLKVGGATVAYSASGYKFAIEKHTEIKATFKPIEIAAKALESLGLEAKDEGMGNYIFAESKVKENIVFKYDIPRTSTEKSFTRVFSIEKAGLMGDTSKAYLFLNDASGDYQGDIWDVLNNIGFAKQEGNVLSGVTVPAAHVGYWGNATAGNKLTASNGSDTLKAENFDAMFVAEVAGTYRITVKAIDVTDKASVNFSMPLAIHTVTVVVK